MYVPAWKAKHLVLACVATLLVMQVIPVLRSAENDKEAARQYTVGIEGAKGVKLTMLLITKPTPRAPLTRETKVVTVPFTTTFKAQTFYVWFDTLPDGASGNEGDQIRSVYRIDGDLQGAGFDLKIKKANNSSVGFGNQ